MNKFAYWFSFLAPSADVDFLFSKIFFLHFLRLFFFSLAFTTRVICILQGRRYMASTLIPFTYISFFCSDILVLWCIKNKALSTSVANVMKWWMLSEKQKHLKRSLVCDIWKALVSKWKHIVRKADKVVDFMKSSIQNTSDYTITDMEL